MPAPASAAAFRGGAGHGLRLALAVLLGAGAGEAAEFDVILRGGTVFTGDGSPGRVAAVAWRGDRIAVVGELPTGSQARLEIDASGLVVAPGFIDGHSHAGPGLATPERAGAVPLLAQGVTTVFINPDGGGPAELAPQRAAIAAQRPGVNVAPLIGHNAVRTAVLGLADRAPDRAELARMEALVRAAMEEGAFGLSSGPFYAPGSFADTAELAALAAVAGAQGGFHTSHIRDEGDYGIGVVAAVEEVIEISRRARLPGIITHIKVLGPAVWGRAPEVIRVIEAARAEGLAIWADQYPYEASSTSLAAALLPRRAQEGGGEALRRRLGDPAYVEQLRPEVRANLARRAGAGAIQIRSCPAEPALEGRRLDAIARARGEDPVDTALDLLRRGSVEIVSFIMRDDDIAAFMVQPWTMTCSDGDLPEFGRGAAHPRSYGTFPRKLRVYALERGLLSLARALESMTGQPARVLGVADRGVLRPGAFADVVVFDPRRLRDTATYERPHALAEGMVHVFVNGVAAISAGEVTGQRAGRVLRRDRN